MARTWWLAAALMLGASPALAQSALGSHGAGLAEPTAGARETKIDLDATTIYETNAARSSVEVAAKRSLNDLAEQSSDTEFGAVRYVLNRRILLGLNLSHSARAANFPGLSYSDVLAAFDIRVRLH